MQINDDGAEIDGAADIHVFGDWVKFTDGDGSIVKMPPSTIKKLMAFAVEHAEQFSQGAWSEECDFSHIDRNAVLQELLPELDRLFGLHYKPLKGKEE